MSKETKTTAVEEKVNLLTQAIDAAIESGVIDVAPSLKAMANVFGLNPQRIYSVAKTPKEGEVYDAHVYNWDAIERFITRRLSDDMNMEQFVAAAIEKDIELKANDGRTRVRLTDEEKYVKCSKGLMPKRKYNFNVGDNLLLKKDEDNVYVIVLMSDTHVVIAPVDYPTEYKVLANWTFNSGVISPFRFEEVLEARKARKEAAEAEPNCEVPSEE